MIPAPPGERMLRALAIKGIPAGAKVVLAVLAYHDGPGGCFPSAETIAAEAGMSRRNVFAHMNTLEKRGLVLRLHQRHSNRYVLNSERIKAGVTVQPTAPRQDGSQCSLLHPAQDGSQCSPLHPDRVQPTSHVRVQPTSPEPERNRKKGREDTPKAPLKGGCSPCVAVDSPTIRRELPQTRLGFRDGLIGRRQFIELRDYWVAQGGDLLAMLADNPEGAREAAGLWRRSKGYGPEADEA